MKTLLLILTLATSALAQTPAEVRANIDAGKWEHIAFEVYQVRTGGALAFTTVNASDSPTNPNVRFRGITFLYGHPQQATFAEGDRGVIIAERRGNYTAGESVYRGYLYICAPMPSALPTPRPAATPTPRPTGVADRKAQRVR